MGRPRPILGAIVIILILTAGCLDMAVSTSVNSAGDIEKYQITLTTTPAVYAVMNAPARESGSASFKDMMQDPRPATENGPAFDHLEQWSREGNEVIITMTARHPNAIRDGTTISVVRDGDYLVFRQEIPSSLTSALRTSESPYPEPFPGMFTFGYYLTMPGEIIESNADTVHGNTAEWRQSGFEMPSLYARARVPVFSLDILVGMGAVALVAAGFLIVVYLGRRHLRVPAEHGPEEASGFRQALQWTVPPHSYPVPQPPLQARPGPKETATRYVPYTRSRSSRAATTGGSPERTLKFALIGGSILWIVLFGAAMAQTYLGNPPSPSPQETVYVPTVTGTPLRTTAPPSTQITTLIPTRTAGTLSPYSVDPGSITPNPVATKYVAPGYRNTVGGTVPDSGQTVVLVTPYPFVTDTPLLPRSTSITTALTTARPMTTTPTPSPPPPELPDGKSQPPSEGDGSPCNCDADTYNCGDPLALTCYGYCMALGKGDVHRLDRDKDGKPCEDTKQSEPQPPVPERNKTYTISVRVEGFGSVLPAGPVDVKAGEDVNFQLIRDPPTVTPSVTGSDNYTIHNIVQLDPPTMELPPYQDPTRNPEAIFAHPDSRLTTSYAIPNVQSNHTLRVVFYKVLVPQA